MGKTMSSTNKTEHLQLNQWVGTDPFRMEDFNVDNTKIDAAVKANAQAIAANAQAIQANAQNIAANATAISNNTKSIQTNAAAISNHTSAITALQNSALRIAVGSYQGSGTFGQANPKTLTVGFRPKYVRIMCTEGGVAGHFYGLDAIAGTSGAIIYGNYMNSSFQKPVTLTWLDNGISWYSTENATFHMNNSDFVYYYMMLG